MKWLQQFDLFLFDFDGLLVNTEEIHFRAYREMCQSFGYELKWDFLQYCQHAHIHYANLRQAIYNEFPDMGEKYPVWDVLYQDKRKRYLKLLEEAQIKLLPGVEALLKQLAISRVKRCIVTNSTKEQVALIKRAHPVLKTVPVWITREDYENAKPAPDGYFKALDLLADPEDRIVGFEDTYRGLQALSATRAKPVLICDPKHLQLAQEDLSGIAHFSSFEAIPKEFS